MAECFNCNSIIEDNAVECPLCKSPNNIMKQNFIKYIGDRESLAGYQKSYKLVLLKYIIESLDQRKEALVSAVIAKIRNFYLSRFNQGLLPDIDVDERIRNIESSNDYDVFAVIKNQPYHVINAKGFLYINRNSEGDLVFVFNEEISNSLSQNEFEKLLDIINYKLKLYYSTKLHDSIDYTSNYDDISITDSSPNSLPQQNENDLDNKLLNTEIINIDSLSTRSKRILLGHKINNIRDLIAFDNNNGIESFNILGSTTYHAVISVINSYYASIKSFPLNKRLIRHLFCDKSYASFVRYCQNNKLKTIEDLQNFDFDRLIVSFGFGEGKINQIKEKYAAIVNGTNEKTDQNQNRGIVKVFEETVIIAENNKALPVSILSLVGLSGKTILKLSDQGYHKLEDLGNVGRTQLSRLFGVRNSEKIFNAINEFSKPLIVIANDVLNSLKTENSFKMYVMRSEKLSLQEVADIFNCTRERVRQVEVKLSNKLKPLMLGLIENYLIDNNTCFISEERILEIFDEEDFDKVIIHVLKSCDEIEYLNFAKLFLIKKSEYQDTYSTLCKVARDFIGDGRNIFNELDALEELLSNLDFEFMNVDLFFDLLIEMNAYFYGDFVAFERQSYSKLCVKVIEKEFKNGIHVSDDDEMNKLRTLTISQYGNIPFPEKNRAIAAAISKHLILCGRGTLTSIKNLNFDFSTIESISKYIDESQQTSFYYRELFDEFQGVLFITSNITNYNCLHGVLQYCFPEKYIYSRDFVTKLEFDGKIEPLENRINSFITTTGHAVGKDVLLKEFKGCSDVMIFNTINTSKRLIQWDYNSFNSVDNIAMSEAEYSIIAEGLNVITSENNGYCSDYLAFNYVCNSIPDWVIKNSITNKSNLFYVLSNVFYDLYDFRRPHIGEKGKYPSLNTKDIILNLLESSNIISYRSFLDIANRLGWSSITTAATFTDIESSYIRIDEDTYLRKSLFIISNSEKEELENYLAKYIRENRYLSLINYDDYDELPTVNDCEWNEFLFESIVQNYFDDYRIVQPKAKDRRYVKSIIVDAHSKYNSIDELVRDSLELNNVSTISERNLLSYMILNGFTRKVIPKEMYISDCFYYEDGSFTVK
ncbi:MAG: hypothetical protein IJI47_06300 [Eubacterium sp.]|nr:hypothetical protein [Eubacterium sp.]